MTEFTSSTVIPYDLDTVFQWHSQPGALTRMSPEWAQQVIAEAHPPLQTGARAHLRTSVPNTHGVIRVPFVSEHGPGPTAHSFVDRMVRGPLLSWEHVHEFTPVDSGACRISDTIDYSLLPGDPAALAPVSRRLMEPTLEATFAARTDRLLADLEYQRQLAAISGGGSRRILVAGASGTIGSQVTALLSTGGHEVRRLVRRTPRRADEVRWDPDLGLLNRRDVAWADVIIHLGGTSIGTRFTAAATSRIRSSRIDSTRLLVSTLAALPAEDRPEAFVCASGVGYYGSRRGDEPLTEASTPGDGFLAEVCEQWEAEAARVEDAGVRWVSVRTGVVLTSLSGVLRLQLPLFLSGLGGPLGSGQQWLSWISLDDIARIYARAALDASLHGPVNASSPQPVRQHEFAATLAELAGRPAAIPVPRFGPQLLLGRQGADELAMADQRAVPEALAAHGYPFRFPALRAALAATAGFEET